MAHEEEPMEAEPAQETEEEVPPADTPLADEETVVEPAPEEPDDGLNPEEEMPSAEEEANPREEAHPSEDTNNGEEPPAEETPFAPPEPTTVDDSVDLMLQEDDKMLDYEESERTDMVKYSNVTPTVRLQLHGVK